MFGAHSQQHKLTRSDNWRLGFSGGQPAKSFSNSLAKEHWQLDNGIFCCVLGEQIAKVISWRCGSQLVQVERSRRANGLRASPRARGNRKLSSGPSPRETVGDAHAEAADEQARR